MEFNKVFLSERGNQLLEQYIMEKDYHTILVFARYLYSKTDKTLLTDKDYDTLMNSTNYSDLKDTLYEDDHYDDKVRQLIDIFESDYLTNSENKIDKSFEEIIDAFPYNQSMRYFGNVGDLMDNLNGSANSKYLISYKHDGWNISVYYAPGQTTPILAHTRGRGDAAIKDCTELMTFLCPQLEVDKLTKVKGELVLTRQGLARIREELPDKSWVNIRSSISSFIAYHVPRKYWDAVEFKPFGIEEVNTERLPLLEQYKLLGELGFKPPIYGTCDYNNIPRAIQYMENKYITEYEHTYECDGITIAEDNMSSTGVASSSIYAGNIVAYKGGIWDSEQLEGEIEEIVYSYNKRYYTPIARIKPLKTKIGNTIVNVPLNHLANVQKYWLEPGSIIKIEYQSQQNVFFKGIPKIYEEDMLKRRKEYLEKCKEKEEEEKEKEQRHPSDMSIGWK